MDEIINKVAQSGIITLDLNDFRPSGKRLSIDIAEQLWEGIALKEKDFRDWVKTNDWSVYTDTHVALYCSADAIIPSWAYMLIAAELQSTVSTLYFGDLIGLEEHLYYKALSQVDFSEFNDARVMLKGCGDKVPMGSYVYLTAQLRPHVKSLMFGEPCSAVPVYKAPKK